MYVYTQCAISHRTPTQYAPTINGHPWQYYHGHRVVLTLPHRAVPCSVESREEWLPKSECPPLHHQRTVAQSCGGLPSHHYSTKTPTNVTEDMEAHPLAFQSSRCTNGSTGHVTKKYASDFQRIMNGYDCTVLGVRWLLAHKSVQLKSKLQHTGTWSAATRPHLAACVTDQPYSSTTFVALRLHHRTEKNWRAFQNCIVSFLF